MTRLSRLLCAILLIGGVTPCTRASEASEGELDRHGWAWGVHAGLGTGQIVDGDEDQPRRFGVSTGGWVGFGLGPEWVLRADLRVWKRMSPGESIFIGEPSLGVAFYPNGEALFFHAGAGAGYAALEAWDDGTRPVWAWGHDLSLGIGYEFPLSPTRALSVQMDASYTYLGRLSPENVKLRRVGVNYTDIVFTYSWY